MRKQSFASVSSHGNLKKNNGNASININSNGARSDIFTFVGLLKACTQRKDVCQGNLLHIQIQKLGLLEENHRPYLASALISMYATFDILFQAYFVLENLPFRCTVCWNAFISGCSQQGRFDEALICFELMQMEGLSPDAVTFICILKVCGNARDLVKGKEVHGEVLSRNLIDKDVVIGTSLVCMYTKCGELSGAKDVLEMLPIRDVVTWSAIISGYAQQGLDQEALSSFGRMKNEGVSPNGVTLLCTLKACANLRDMVRGEDIYTEIVTKGLVEEDNLLDSALVDMYAKCGAFVEAQKVLKMLPMGNEVSWSALIAGYAEKGRTQEALECFKEMQSKGFSPNVVTLLAVLKACGTQGLIEKGEQIHGLIAATNNGSLLKRDMVVLGTALVDMYVKCGELSKARKALRELPIQNTALWNALIAGYARQGQGWEALKCFEWMQTEDVSPNVVTFTCILKACGSVAAIEQGKQIHNLIANMDLLTKDIQLGNILVDMYAKCGMLAKAMQVLEELPLRNTISWNSLIAGYAQQGQGHNALECLERMQSEGITPNEATFSCVLGACTYLGLSDEAQVLLGDMEGKYGIRPSLEHHTCVVMMLGFGGHFDKAMSMLKAMQPSSDNLLVWLAMLSVCKRRGNVRLGRLVFEEVIKSTHSFCTGSSLCCWSLLNETIGPTRL